jgi:serine/threonine protein phosphatase PrpC
MFANRDSSIDPTSPALLLVCSDGVWDNWKFQDVVQYFKGNKY